MVLVMMAVALFGYPVLAVVDHLAISRSGIWLPVYLFAAWAVVIIAMAVLMTHRQDRN